MAADERLSRDRRVRKRQDFLRIQSSRRKYRSAHLLVALTAPRQLGSRQIGSRQLGSRGENESRPSTSRLGITVTRKIDKRAARRNRIKRWVRECFRKQRSHFREQVDMVVIALDGAAELDYQQLTKELHGLFLRAGLLTGEKA